jgi:uncharacterized protein
MISGRDETSPKLHLSLLDGRYAIVQLDRNAPLPPWASAGEFFTVTRTSDELSVVCLESNVPDSELELRVARDWACLKLQGPFEFALTGVLLSVLEPLARAKIGIFALSTFNTDYVLVACNSIETAISALEDAGHTVSR